MSDTAVSITAIVVSGVVGPSLTAWWARQRHRDDLQRELRAELATVLDEGVSALGHARRANIRIWLLYNAGADPESAEAREAFAERRRLMPDVRYTRDRMAIRLGADHPIHRAFAACVETLDDRREFAGAYERGLEIEGPLERQRVAHERLDATREAFLDAARQLIGPRLDLFEQVRQPRSKHL